MTSGLIYVFAFLFGYLIFHTLSHPEKKKHIVPRFSLKSIQILPNIQFHGKEKIIHFHHWFVLAFLVLVTVIVIDPTNYTVTKFLQGAAFGGIIQGLSYKDRFKFRFPKTNTKAKKTQK